jgi:UDP-N-acetylenolpyruvoylglucosamine reductase
MIAIAVGIGLYVFFNAMQAEGVPDGVKWLALIPGLVGVALLLNWALERGEKNGQDKP